MKIDGIHSSGRIMRHENVLVIPASPGGEKALNLECGVYILDCGATNIKFKI